MGLPNEIHPFHLAGAGQGYQVANSLRFRGNSSASLTKSAYGGFATTWTWSCWLKRGYLGVVTGSNTSLFTSTDRSDYFDFFYFNSSDQLSYWHRYNYGDSTFITNARYRDIAAWYHVVLIVDPSQSSNSNRVKIYVNGVLESITVSGTWTQNENSRLFSPASATSIGGTGAVGSNYYDGYMAEMNLVDGSYDPSYFGKTDTVTGQWVPKKYTGSYGSSGSGFYLPFNDSTSTTTLGYDRQLGMSDSSKNNWTLNNFAVYSPANTATYLHDVYWDVPTNWNDGSTTYNRGNYPVMNFLNENGYSYAQNGNLEISGSGAGEQHQCTMTLPKTGKWLFEAYSFGSGGSGIVGWFGVAGSSNSGALHFSGLISRIAVNPGNGYYQDDSLVQSGYIGGNGIIYTMAIDMDSKTLYMYFDGAYQRSLTITTADVDLYMYYGSYTSCYGYVNYGQRPFRHPQIGYLALNSYNMQNPSLPLV